MSKKRQRHDHWFMREPYRSLEDEEVWALLYSRWLEHQANRKPYKKNVKPLPFIPIRQFSIEGEYLGTYSHPREAMRAIGREKASHHGITKVCDGDWTHSHGFDWDWAKDGNIKNEIRETESRNQEKTDQER